MKIFDFYKLKKGFRVAFEGLGIALKEQTFRILCFCAVLVIFLMIVLGLGFFERIIIIILVISVLAFELVNTQIEKILDFLQPNHDPKVKIIKDVSAGAVLLVSMGAAIIGFLIFCPYFIKLFDFLFK